MDLEKYFSHSMGKKLTKIASYYMRNFFEFALVLFVLVHNDAWFYKKICKILIIFCSFQYNHGSFVHIYLLFMHVISKLLLCSKLHTFLSSLKTYHLALLGDATGVLINWDTKSMGTGKIIVLFFSAAMELKV